MRGPTLCYATHPRESRLLDTSRLGVHTSLGSSTLRDLRILCATCIPLAFHYDPHCSSCRDIAISQLRDPHGQTLGPFLARSRDTIPRTDPMVLLCSGSNDCPSIATSRPRDLEYQCLDSQPMNSRVRKIHRSLATCPLIWTAMIFSILRRLATLNIQFLGFHPANS